MSSTGVSRGVLRMTFICFPDTLYKQSLQSCNFPSRLILIPSLGSSRLLSSQPPPLYSGLHIVVRSRRDGVIRKDSARTASKSSPMNLRQASQYRFPPLWSTRSFNRRCSPSPRHPSGDPFVFSYFKYVLSFALISFFLLAVVWTYLLHKYLYLCESRRFAGG
jgi:hypothetical protein